MIISDTREKTNEHILDYFKKNNIDFKVECLKTGDYINTDNPKIVIDRKKSIGECATNLCTSDKLRFWRELKRSYTSGQKFIILVECGGKIKTIADVPSWKSKFSTISGARVQEEMYRVGVAYNVTWLFCDKRSTGRRIVEILGG